MTPRLHTFESKNPQMQRIMETINKVASTNANVMLLGETGTGKDVLAYHLHSLSRRREGPFTIVDSGALSDSLLESELFGHVKGAFTGALVDRAGLVEAAEGGTLFLNEFTEATPGMQLRLLHLLQYKSYRRLGERDWRSADIRFIAASNRDPSVLIEQGKFREDLYHRLKVVELQLPPLRERREDIPALIQCFIDSFRAEHGLPDLAICPKAIAAMQEYRWPGNIRQLEHCIEFLVVTADDDVILSDDVRRSIWAKTPEGDCEDQLTLFDGFKDFLEQTLRKHNWNKSQAAEKLGINRSTLYRRMKKYGINPLGPERRPV